MPTITVDAQLAGQITQNLAKALANSPHPLADQFRLRVGYALLQNIARAFEVRSGPAGPRPGFGPPAAGYAWQKLAPSTIAARRIGKKEKKSLAQKTKQAQKTAQNRKKYVQKRSKELTGVYVRQGDEVAQATARALRDAESESRVKFPGPTTKRQVLAQREVMILRDTGRLFSSLLPGQIVGGRIQIPKDQILASIPGLVTIGSDVEYADRQHFGTNHIPARPFWPEPDRFPQEWWDDVNDQATQALVEVLTHSSLPEMLATV